MAQSTAHPVTILPTLATSNGELRFPVTVGGILIFRHPTQSTALNCPELFLPDVLHNPYVNTKHTITYSFIPTSITITTRQNGDREENFIRQVFCIENGLIKYYTRKQYKNGNHEDYIREYSGCYPIYEQKTQQFTGDRPETREYVANIFYIMASAKDKQDISVNDFILNIRPEQQPNLGKITYPHYQYKSVICRSNGIKYMHRFEKYYVREDKTVRIGLVVYFCGANPDNMIAYQVDARSVRSDGQKITDPDIIKVVQENVM